MDSTSQTSSETTDSKETTVQVTTPQKRSPIVRCLSFFGFLILAFILFEIVDSRPWRGPVISKDTTVLTEPLTADGNYVDYSQAIANMAPAGIDTDANGFRMLVQQFGPQWFFECAGHSDNHFAFECEQWCKKLGLDPNAKPGANPGNIFSDFKKEFDKKYSGTGKEEQYEKLLNRLHDIYSCPACNSGWPDSFADGQKNTDELFLFVKNRTDRIGPSLDLIRKAVHKDLFYIPLVKKNKARILSQSINFDRDKFMGILGRELTLRAKLNAAAGNFDAAIDDIVAITKLARHLLNQQDNFVVSVLQGMAVDSYARIAIDDNPRKPMSGDQWKRLVEAIRSVPVSNDYQNSSEMERFLFLDFLQAYSQGENVIDHQNDEAADSGKDSFSKKCFAFVIRNFFDWDLIFKEANTYYDLHPDELTEVLSRSVQTSPSLLLTEEGRSHQLALNLSGLSVGGRVSTMESIKRHQCTLNVQNLIFAMKLYLAEHKTLPPAFTVDTQGKPLHSWRVLLLPYLGQKELYDRIHLNEPWDSEYNRQFHHVNVPFYQCPAAVIMNKIRYTNQWTDIEAADKNERGLATYSVIVGPNSLFDLSGKGKDLSSLQNDPKRKTMAQILVAERPDPICWMKPDAEIAENLALHGPNCRNFMFDKNKVFNRGRIPNLTLDAAMDLTQGTLSSFHAGGTNIGLLNGACLFLLEEDAQSLVQYYIHGK